MALDFPTSPTIGQSFTGPDGTVWTWDGVKWVGGASASGYAPLNSPVFTGNPQAPTAAPGDNDTSLATTAFVQSAVAPALNDVGRNLIHNPLFNITQRGGRERSRQRLADTADRWSLVAMLDSSSVFLGAIADADRTAIGDEAASICLNNTFTGNAGAASFSVIQHKIERVRRLAGKTVTISFYAVATAGLKLGVGIDQNFGTGGSPSPVVLGAGVAVPIPGNWARYSVTLTVPSATGKTIGTDGNDSTTLNFWYSAGSTMAVRAGNIGVQSGSVNLWGVQLEIGSVATPLEKPDPQQDLAKCQRFFWVGRMYSGSYQSVAAASVASSWPFPTQMRAAPTLTITTNSGQNNTGTPLFSPVVGGIFAQVTNAAVGFTTVDLAFTASADL